jgi:hypothetical protein
MRSAFLVNDTGLSENFGLIAPDSSSPLGVRGLRKLHGEGYEVSLKAIFAAIAIGGGIVFVVQCAATH